VATLQTSLAPRYFGLSYNATQSSFPVKHGQILSLCANFVLKDIFFPHILKEASEKEESFS